MDVATILNLIDAGEYGLPKFQRGYVWSRHQVRRFMSSLYHRNPVGSLLIWVPHEATDVRKGSKSPAGNIKLIVDGQQRLTTLYGIVRGEAPPFFIGNAGSFRDLYFHLDAEKGEEFEFYGPVRMKNNPRWVSVTEVLQKGSGRFFEERIAAGLLLPADIANLNRLDRVLEKEFHAETITGRGLDEVVNIFNEVNSGGTKLSSADLAMAKVSVLRSSARKEMEVCLQKWRNSGYDFSFNWLLRGITIQVFGDARYSALEKVDAESFGEGLRQFSNHIDDLLLQIRANLGLDNSSVLRSEFALLVLARYLKLNGGLRQGEAEIARLLFWYIHCVLWGRYSVSVEGRLNQDLAVLQDSGAWEGQISGLIESLRSERGTLTLTSQDFYGSWRNNRFYPLLYLLTRVGRARDLMKNIPLSMNLIGNPLELHHIFPKRHLYDLGRNRRDVNTLANFAFLTSESNRSIGWSLPRDYLAECEELNPGVLASQWIPDDPRLWELENYDEFLSARRELLAAAANAMLDSLGKGHQPQPGSFVARPAESVRSVRAAHISSDEEERELEECQEWMERNSLPRGKSAHELVDESNSEPLAVLDLAWPDGVQEGLGQPVALLIDEDDGTRNAAQQYGFRYFTTLAEFKHFVEQTALAE
ncbi:MAG: DUF262 domain-containing protein [Gammaproteobacteria bacterium]|nr:DUF262 domain-containing protein [Gammaproteobacteria bacterium]